MADAATNGPTSAADKTPTVAPNPPSSSGKDFGSIHRVKKLLDTYIGSAGRTLTGPANTALEDVTAHFKRAAAAQASSASPATTVYKLPPDVELSKEEDDSTLKKRIRLDSSNDKVLDEKPNGMVTLSRIDDDLQPSDRYGGRHGYQRSHRYSSDEPGSNSYHISPKHLSGDMIRKLNQQGSKGTISVIDTERLTSQDKYARPAKVYPETFKRPVNGGGGSAVTIEAQQRPLPPPNAAAPILITRDHGQAELTDTTVEGEKIMAFAVGGEMRLCFPQLLNTVLVNLQLPDINLAFDELCITCSICSPNQLELLKQSKVLPISAPQCGLITKSDAERLCAYLLDRNHPAPIARDIGFNATSSPFSFKVEHECFGQCLGLLLPEAFISPNARCIECLECGRLYSPQRFVCHSHSRAGTKTCHWGFEASNWRSYLHLYEGYSETDKEKLGRKFIEFKKKFATAAQREALISSTSPVPPALAQDRHRKSSNDDNNQYSAPPHPKKQRLSADVSAEVLAGRGTPPGAAPGSVPAHGPPPGVPPFFPGDPYGVYYLSSWAAAAASGKAHPMHAAWAASIQQAMKEGKAPPMFPGVPGAFPAPSGYPPYQGRSSSRSRGEAEFAAHYRRRSSASPSHGARSGSSLKSSPSSIESPINHHGLVTRDSPPDNGTTPVSHHHRPRTVSSSLAEDIQAIRDALDGASSSAKERTLKILERLTARLALAETDRDAAIAEKKKLQKLYDNKSEELEKKRAELRELLRQETAVGAGNGNPTPPDSEPPNNRSSVTLELLPGEPVRRRSVHGSDLGGQVRQSNFAGLPKVEMKSPARIIEEKERSSTSSRSSAHTENELVIATNVDEPVSKPLNPPPPAVSATLSEPAPTSLSVRSSSQRHRSGGTPTSTKSRDSEELRELRDRLLTMEHELRALRDDRSSQKVATGSSEAIRDPEAGDEDKKNEDLNVVVDKEDEPAEPAQETA